MTGSAPETLCVEPWMLTVERHGDAYALDIAVESSFASWNRTFAITRAQAEALVRDRARRLALHRVLHGPLQMERRRPLPPGFPARLIETAASAPLDGLDETLMALEPNGEA